MILPLTKKVSGGYTLTGYGRKVMRKNIAQYKSDLQLGLTDLEVARRFSLDISIKAEMRVLMGVYIKELESGQIALVQA